MSATPIAARADWQAVPIEQYQQARVVGERLVAIASGPYRLNFHKAPCPTCDSVNLLRHYGAKTLALLDTGADKSEEDQAARLAGMDSIALAQEFIASKRWISAGGCGRFIGLGAMYLNLPQEVAMCNASVAVRLEGLQAARQEVLPVAGFASDVDGIGRKCLRPVCRQCGAGFEKENFPTEKMPPRFSFNLTLAGELALFNWPLLVGELSLVNPAGGARP